MRSFCRTYRLIRFITRAVRPKTDETFGTLCKHNVIIARADNFHCGCKSNNVIRRQKFLNQPQHIIAVIIIRLLYYA